MRFDSVKGTGCVRFPLLQSALGTLNAIRYCDVARWGRFICCFIIGDTEHRHVLRDLYDEDLVVEARKFVTNVVWDVDDERLRQQTSQFAPR